MNLAQVQGLEPQELAHRRGPGQAQEPQGSAHRRGLGPQEPQEPVLRPGLGPQEPQELVLRRGLESFRVRLMESPQLGELLESLPEAVLFPHLHRQNP